MQTNIQTHLKTHDVPVINELKQRDNAEVPGRSDLEREITYWQDVVRYEGDHFLNQAVIELGVGEMLLTRRPQQPNEGQVVFWINMCGTCTSCFY